MNRIGVVDFSKSYIIRAIPFPNLIKNHQVHHKAFKPGKGDLEHGLSGYRNLPKVTSVEDAQVLAKWHSRDFISGDICGLCYLREEEFSELGIVIIDDPVANTAKSIIFFGDQHVLMRQLNSPDSCPDSDKQLILALRASLLEHTYHVFAQKNAKP